MKCKICGKELQYLQTHINRIHNMTVLEYKNKYNVSKVNSVKGDLK